MANSDLIGTQLRQLLDLVDAGIAAAYEQLGLPDFRPRYNPILRLVDRCGPQSISALAAATGVTHSAASQTVAQAARDGLVELTPGGCDARQRIVALTAKASRLMPTLDREWAATSAAAQEWQAELDYPLSDLLTAAIDSLLQRPFAERISTHL